MVGTMSLLALSLARLPPPMPFWSAGRFGSSEPWGPAAPSLSFQNAGDLFPGHLTCLDSAVGEGSEGDRERLAVGSYQRFGNRALSKVGSCSRTAYR